MSRIVTRLAVLGLLLGITWALVADDDLLQPVGSRASPASQPMRPLPANVSPAAQKVLADVNSAYSKISSIEFAGTVRFDNDIDGKPEKYTDKFHGFFQSPNKFVSEMAGNMIVGSTGQKAYAFSVEDNAFIQKDAPADRYGDWPSAVWDVVIRQNPSLAMLLSGAPANQLVETAKVLCSAQADAAPVTNTPTTIELLSPTALAGQQCLTLQMTNDSGVFTFLIDPQTHLLRQFNADQRKYFEKIGHQQVNKATLVFDYTSVSAPGKTDDKQFVWVPPKGARELTAPVANAAQADGAAAALIGKPAPNFHLLGLDGKPVTLSEQKGSVVVLDFWATWCGPCVGSLPNLNKLYEDHKAAGVKVFAISVDEDQTPVKPFVESHKLTLHVLFNDDKHEAAQNYAVEGIPETVVIGKDGIIKQVLVGAGPDTEEVLTKTVEDALK